MSRLSSLFASRTVLCDGAMGTSLYARGVFINRCYDELNLSDPELIRSIHEEYLQAGAEIIETNTFGANRFRLQRHGLQDQVRDINPPACGSPGRPSSSSQEKQAGHAHTSPAPSDRSASASSLWAKPASTKPAPPSPNRSRALADRRASTCSSSRPCTALNEAEQALARRPTESRPTCPCSSWSPSTTTATASTAHRRAGRRAPHRVGRRRHRRQLLHRPRHRAHRDRAHARRHRAAPRRHAQRRHAPRHRRPQHLSLLAGVHGQLCAQSSSRPARSSSAAAAAPRPTTSAPCVPPCAPSTRSRPRVTRRRQARRDLHRDAARAARPSAPTSAASSSRGEFVTLVEIVPPQGHRLHARKSKARACSPSSASTPSMCRTRRAPPPA